MILAIESSQESGYLIVRNRPSCNHVEITKVSPASKDQGQFFHLIN